MSKTTGERIRELRTTRVVGATELARSIGVSANYIHKLESGRNNGTKEVLAKIAKELRTTVDYLVGRTDDWTQPAESTAPLPAPDIADLVVRLNKLPAEIRRHVRDAITAILEALDIQTLSEQERDWLRLFEQIPPDRLPLADQQLRGLAQHGDITGEGTTDAPHVAGE